MVSSSRTSDRLTDDFGILSSLAAPEMLPSSAMYEKTVSSVMSSMGRWFHSWNVESIGRRLIGKSGTA